MSRSARARRGLAADARGATAIEFGFVIGLIIMLVIGTVQVGRVLMARNDVSHALSQVVRVVHLNPQMTRSDIDERLRTLLEGYEHTRLDVCVRPIGGTSYMEIVVEFPFELSVPFVPFRVLQLRVDTMAPRVSPFTDGQADMTVDCSTV